MERRENGSEDDQLPPHEREALKFPDPCAAMTLLNQDPRHLVIEIPVNSCIADESIGRGFERLSVLRREVIQPEKWQKTNPLNLALFHIVFIGLS